MIVDAHAHPYFADCFPGAAPGTPLTVPADWRAAYERLHGGTLHVPTLEAFIEGVRAAGIDRVLVFDRDVETRTGAPVHNEWVLDLCDRHPDLFVPLVAVDPNRGRAALPAIEAAVERGARGLKVHPYGADLRPDDPRCYALYEAAQELGLPILFHTGPGPLRTRSDLSDVRAFDAVCCDFPDLQLVLAHMGGDQFMAAHMLAWRYPQVFLDIAFVPEPYLRAMPWQLFAETIPDQILLGSDFPLVRPEDRLATLRRLPIPDDVRDRIAGANAARVFDLA